MKNKKVLLIILAAVLVLVLALTAVVIIIITNNQPDESCTEHIDADGDLVCDNCGEALGSKEPPKEELVLSDKTLFLDINEQATLTVNSGALAEQTWTSSDENVASVDENGTVTGVGDGKCEITLTNANGNASCVVVVANTYTSPVLLLSSDGIELTKDSEYIISPVVRYKGEDITDLLSFEFAVVDGESESIVSLTSDGSKLLLKGLEYGNTKVVVYTEYGELAISRVVDISVKEMGIVFDFDNLSPMVGGYSAQLSTFAMDGYPTEITPSLTIYNGKNEITDASVTYTSADESVVRIENGSMVSAGNGETVVTASYNGNTVDIKVTVSKPVVDIAASNGTLEIGRPSEIVFDSALQGVLVDAKIGDVSVGDSIVEGKLKLDQTKLYTLPISSHGKGISLAIETDLISYRANIDIYTLVIKDEADYASLGAMSKAYYPDDVFMFGGYFILGNNITVTGGMNEFIDRDGGAQNGIKGDGSQGFRGVFDGNGYVIDGLSRTGSKGNSFISALHKDGIIQNLGFTNVTYASTGGSFLVHVGSGTIRDVYVQYKEISESGAWSGTVMQPTVTIERMLVDASDTIVSGTGKNFSLFAVNYGPVKVINDSYYVILPKGFDTDPKMIKVDNSEKPPVGIKAFYSFELFKASAKFENALNWMGDMWHIDTETGVITFGATK